MRGRQPQKASPMKSGTIEKPAVPVPDATTHSGMRNAGIIQGRTFNAADLHEIEKALVSFPDTDWTIFLRRVIEATKRANKRAHEAEQRVSEIREEIVAAKKAVREGIAREAAQAEKQKREVANIRDAHAEYTEQLKQKVVLYLGAMDKQEERTREAIGAEVVTVEDVATMVRSLVDRQNRLRTALKQEPMTNDEVIALLQPKKERTTEQGGDSGEEKAEGEKESEVEDLPF